MPLKKPNANIDTASTIITESCVTMDTLYNNHHSWLFRWLTKKVGSEVDAADLVQDTFVRVLVNQKSYNDVSNIKKPRNYLTTIANRILIDRIRRSYIERAYLETLRLQPEYFAISPETREIIISSLVEIDKMLDKLGMRTREIFLMAQIDGLSYAEISRRLSLSTNTVRKHFSRAILVCLELEED